MAKATKKVSVGNMIMVIALMLIVFNGAMVSVNAAQGNQSHNFVFDFEGDVDSTARRTKWYTGDSAYIQCTGAESDSATFDVTFCFWNSDDGTQRNNTSDRMWQGREKWVSNGAAAGDETWFEGRLVDCGMYEDEGGVFSVRWRPDSSSY